MTHATCAGGGLDVVHGFVVASLSRACSLPSINCRSGSYSSDSSGGQLACGHRLPIVLLTPLPSSCPSDFALQRLIVVANRLPVSAYKDRSGRWQLQASGGRGAAGRTMLC